MRAGHLQRAGQQLGADLAGGGLRLAVDEDGHRLCGLDAQAQRGAGRRPRSGVQQALPERALRLVEQMQQRVVDQHRGDAIRRIAVGRRRGGVAQAQAPHRLRQRDAVLVDPQRQRLTGLDPHQSGEMQHRRVGLDQADVDRGGRCMQRMQQGLAPVELVEVQAAGHLVVLACRHQADPQTALEQRRQHRVQRAVAADQRDAGARRQDAQPRPGLGHAGGAQQRHAGGVARQPVGHRAAQLAGAPLRGQRIEQHDSRRRHDAAAPVFSSCRRRGRSCGPASRRPHIPSAAGRDGTWSR